MAGNVHYRSPSVPFPGELEGKGRLRVGGTIDEQFTDLRGSPEETKILSDIANPENWGVEAIEQDPTFSAFADGRFVPEQDRHISNLRGHCVGRAPKGSGLQTLIAKNFCR